MIVWWKPNTYEGSTAFGIGFTGTQDYIALGIASGSQAFLEGSVGSDSLSAASCAMNDSTWYLLGAVVTSATDWRVWLDAVQASSSNPNYTPTQVNLTRTTGPGLYFTNYGSHANGKGNYWTFWENYQLTQSDMTALRSGGSGGNGVHPTTIQPANIAFCWEVDGSSPEPDVSGNGRDATVVNTSTFTADAPPVDPPVDNTTKPAKAGMFDPMLRPNMWF